MKKSIRLILMILISIYSFTASSQDMVTMMKQQMHDSIIAMCNDRSFLVCTKLNQKKCTSAANGTISACDHLFPKANDAMNDRAFDVHSDCVQNSLLKKTGISAEKFDACDTDEGHELPMDMNESLAMMNQMMQLHAANVGTDGVTLPLYKNATVMSHFSSAEMAQMMDVNPLPSLVLASPDVTKKIVAYYRTKLSGFREHNIDGDILFIKGGPKNFDYVKDFKFYTVTPHVLIAPMQDGLGGPPGTRSKIEIAYKK